MIFSGCSTIEFFTWLIGLLVIYEVSVYVFFTYLKTSTSKRENKTWKSDFSDDEETETEIERLNRLNEEAFNSIEAETIEDDYSTDSDFEDIVDDEPSRYPPAEEEKRKPGQTDRDSENEQTPYRQGPQEEALVAEHRADDQEGEWPFDESNLIDFDSGEQVYLEQEDFQDETQSEISGNPPYLGTTMVNLNGNHEKE